MIRTITAAFVALALTLGIATGARAQSEQEDLLRDSETALSRLARQPDIKDNLPNLLHRAKAVLIFPQIIKGAFIVGGSGGSGVLLARNANGAWSDPAFYSIGAMSLGLQIGGQASASVIVIMTEKGLNAVLEQQAKIGADVNAALGPVGNGVGASTGFASGADMYTYQANQGVFLGASLEGSVIARRQDYNESFYGPGANPRDIVVNQRYSSPKADALRQTLARY